VVRRKTDNYSKLNSGYNQPDVIPKMADAATYATIQNEIAYYAAPSKGRNRYIQLLIFNSFGDGIRSMGNPNTDWFKACVQTLGGSEL